jgi:hypothetical protein
MALPLVSQDDLERAIVRFLENHPEHDCREDVERLQMELATPGTWEAAKAVEVPEDPGSEPQE